MYQSWCIVKYILNPNQHPMAKLQHLNKVKKILDAFEDCEITVYKFLHGLLSTNIFEDHPVTQSIIKDLASILDTMKSAVSISDKTEQWIFQNAEKGYQKQVLQLTEKESGFRFQASKIMNAQLTCLYKLTDLLNSPFSWCCRYHSIRVA